jgi:hypothetical protein
MRTYRLYVNIGTGVNRPQPRRLGRLQPRCRLVCVPVVVLRCFAAMRQLRHLRHYVSGECLRPLMATCADTFQTGLIMANSYWSVRYSASPTPTTAGSHRCRSNGSSSTAIRPHFRRARHAPLATYTRACRQQICVDNVPSAMYGPSPPYLDVSERASDIAARRRLLSPVPRRSGSIVVTSHRLVAVGRRSLPVVGAIVWTSLPRQTFSPPHHCPSSDEG